VWLRGLWKWDNPCLHVWIFERKTQSGQDMLVISPVDKWVRGRLCAYLQLASFLWTWTGQPPLSPKFLPHLGWKAGTVGPVTRKDTLTTAFLVFQPMRLPVPTECSPEGCPSSPPP
jgi:hypothetical protein